MPRCAHARNAMLAWVYLSESLDTTGEETKLVSCRASISVTGILK
jgi:hypothetical protein